MLGQIQCVRPVKTTVINRMLFQRPFSKLTKHVIFIWCMNEAEHHSLNISMLSEPWHWLHGDLSSPSRSRLLIYIYPPAILHYSEVWIWRQCVHVELGVGQWKVYRWAFPSIFQMCADLSNSVRVSVIMRHPRCF